AGGLQEEPAPEAGLAGAQLGQPRAEFLLPLLPEGSLRLFRLEQHRFGAPRWQVDPGIGARVANHHLAEQTAKFFRLARLTRAFGIDEARAELLRRGELARLEQ